MTKLLLALACSTLSVATIEAQRTVSIKAGELTLRPDTRVTMEGAMYFGGKGFEEAKWQGENFRFSNGANITQARFGVWGSLGDKWTGKIDFKVADRQVFLQDVFLDYKIKPQSMYLRAGYYVDPVSVEANAASSFLSLNTPTAISLLAHQTRFMTLSLTHFGKHHYIVGGLYGSSLGSKRSLANRGSDGWGATAKVAYLPINERYNTLYLGAYARYRTPDVSLTGSRDALSFSTHPGSTIDGRNFVGGTLTGVKGYAVFGGEVALTKGKFHLMAEYIANQIYFNNSNPYGRSRAFFQGAYLTASLMLKGNQRQYLNYWGIFSPLSNVPPTGNLELIGRVSHVKANDAGDPSQGIQAINFGQSTVATLGINWYPHGGNLLVGLNYNYTLQDAYASAGGKFSHPMQMANESVDFHTLQCRLQFIF